MCLSGKNGHGKSALLDALTWALWGHARKMSGQSRADDALIRLGQQSMFVIAEVTAQGTRYRIRREYSMHNNKPTTTLDLGIIDAYTGSIKGLSEKTIRATQEKIVQVLGLTYDTFINSVFLRQGQSNEFSKKTPKERKDILAHILGLELYDSLKTRALAHAKNSAQKITIVHDQLKTFEEKQLRIPEIEIHLHDLERTHQELLGHLMVCEKKNALAQQEALLLKEQESHCFLLQEKKETCLRQQQASLTKLTALWLERKRAQQLLKTVPACSHAERDLLTQQVRLWEQRKEEHYALTTHILELQHKRLTQEAYLTTTYQQKKSALTALRDTHKHDLAQVETLIKNLHRQLHDFALAQEKNQALMGELSQILEGHALQEELLVQEKKRYERRLQYLTSFRKQSQQATKALQAVEEKITALTTSHNPTCTWCQQTITHDYQGALLATLQQHHRQIVHKITRLARVTQELDVALASQARELPQRELACRDLTLKKQKIREIELSQHQLCSRIQEVHDAQIEHVQRYKNADQSIHAIEQELHEHERALATLFEHDTLLGKLKAQEIELNDKRIRVMYNPHEHTLVQQQLLELDKQLRLAAEYEREKIRQEERALALYRLIGELREKKREIGNLITQLEPYATIAIKKQQRATQEQECQREYALLRSKERDLMLEKGAFMQELQALKAQQKEIDRLKNSLGELTRDYDDYQLLAQATGKDGIQALLIEHALPELEQEANYLLAKLTDNQTHLTIESVKDLKSGATKETLDIKISDALGIRAYDLFSGGEAFRIDIALRIALSKLLARRAGTTLQTLIIDEGFGSQDEEGLQRIMDALYKIQDDFAKIIIVSHLPSMKEQFPTHFVINKTAAGSTVSVLNHG